MKIQTVWLDHLSTTEEREKFKKHLASTLNDPVVDKLKRILNRKLESLEDKTISEDSYKDTDWPYLMAHRNGYKQALIEILTLIILKDQ